MGVKKLVFKLTWTCLSLCVSSVFWPTIIISSVFLFLLRFIVQKLLNLIYGNGKYSLAQGIDALFAYDKVGGGSPIIHSLFIIKGTPDLLKIKRTYQNNVFSFVENNNNKNGVGLYVQRVKKTFVTKFGFAAWKDTSKTFNLNRHVRIFDGLRITDPINEEKLMSMLSRLMDERDLFNNEHPQWEHLIIPNYHVEGEKGPHFVCIFRVHHAYADGVSFSILIDSVLADSPIQFAVNPLKPFAGSNVFKNAAIHLNALLFGPLQFLLTLKSAVLDKSSLIVKGDYSSRKWLNWSEKIDMKFLKELRTASGSSVSSILITAFTGAVHKLYKGNPEVFGYEVPEEINIGSMAVMLPYKSRQLQNHFSTFSLPCNLKQSDGVKRLVQIDRISRQVSYSSEPTFNFFIMRFSGYLPRIVQDKLADLAGTPVLFSNVPGAKENFCTFGCEVCDAGCWLPLVKTYGIGVATYSYGEQMRLCVSTDSKLFSAHEDLKSFIEDIEDELMVLAKGLLVKNPLRIMDKQKLALTCDINISIKTGLSRRTSYATA